MDIQMIPIVFPDGINFGIWKHAWVGGDVYGYAADLCDGAFLITPFETQEAAEDYMRNNFCLYQIKRYSKKIIVIADSLSNGYLSGGLEYAWPKVTADLLGFDLVNGALNFSGYTPLTTQPYITRINTIPSDYDGYVIMHGALNDAIPSDAELGLLGDGDVTRLYGAIEEAYLAVLNRSPDLVLYALIPHTGTLNENTNTSDGWTYKQGRSAQRTVYQKLKNEYGDRIRLIDAERDFTPNTLLSGALVDGLHPTPFGHTLLGRYVAAQLSNDPMLNIRDLAYSVDFSALSAGNLAGQDGWSVESGSYVIGASGLTVNAVFSSHANGATHATPAGSRTVRALVDGEAIIKWRQQGGGGFAVWTFGNTDGVSAVEGWNFGTIDGASVVIYPPNPQGALTDSNYWLELNQDGGYLNARVWAENATRPVLPSATHVITAAEANNYPLVGSISIVGTSADPVVIKRLEVYR